MNIKPPHQFKTHAVRSPIGTHYRRATCPEFNCVAYRDGWNYHKEALDPATLYMVTHAGKRFREVSIAKGHTFIIFESGQRCFAERTHVVPLHRPEFYFVGRGDRTTFTTRKARQHTNPNDFIDDWATHLDRIAERIKRG